MMKYEVNLIFKENGKSLNETLTDALKIELNKKINRTSNILDRKLPCNFIHNFQNEGSSN